MATIRRDTAEDIYHAWLDTSHVEGTNSILLLSTLLMNNPEHRTALFGLAAKDQHRVAA